MLEGYRHVCTLIVKGHRLSGGGKLLRSLKRVKALMQLLVLKQNFSVEQKHVFQSEYHIKLIEQMVIQIPSKLYIKII